MAQNLKLKVLTLITKLSDRDTSASAAAELDSIAATLASANLSTFLSCILSTDTTDKALTRKHCLHLLSTLSLLHKNSLSSSLPKILAYISKRLRDSDSSIRTQCVATVTSLASNVTKPDFFNSFLKPLSELVFTEQEFNSQIGSCLCLAAAIDGAPNMDPSRLGRVLLPRMERLVKSEGYKAKSAVLVVIGSIIGVGGVSGYGGMNGLVKCLVGFLCSEDWAARKAAAEGLARLAIAERDRLAEFKSGCLKVFERRKFDKVKATREVMNRMIEAWKKVPDAAVETSPPPGSVTSPQDTCDRHHPPGSGNSEVTPVRKRSMLTNRSTPPDSSFTTMRRQKDHMNTAEKKRSLSMSQKSKKPLDWKVDISVCGSTEVSDNTHREGNENVPERRLPKAETRRALFGKNSRVAPSHEENHMLTTVVAGYGNENHNNNHKECEGLTSIRNQLVQIERQQSSLMDVLQRFIGNSQNGMRALETRVQGLEMAMHEISSDLALSNRQVTDPYRSACCMFLGTDFLTPRFWRKAAAGRYSTSRLSSSNATASLVTVAHRGNRDGNTETLENCRLRLQGGRGFIVNPLADIHSESRGESLS